MHGHCSGGGRGAGTWGAESDELWERGGRQGGTEIHSEAATVGITPNRRAHTSAWARKNWEEERRVAMRRVGSNPPGRNGNLY